MFFSGISVDILETFSSIATHSQWVFVSLEKRMMKQLFLFQKKKLSRIMISPGGNRKMVEQGA